MSILSYFAGQDWTPVLSAVKGLLASALTIGGLFVMGKAQTWLVAKAADANASTEMKAVASYGDALNKSLTLAGMRVLPLIAEKGYNSPEVHAAVVHGALALLPVNFPGALLGVGLDPNLTMPANVAKVVDGLTRALPDALAMLEASPATPSAPAPAAG